MLNNVEDASCKYYYAHERNALLERSNCVGTTEDLTKIKNLLINTDVIESCKRERAKMKWKFHKLTKVTFFAALLKEISMGCKDTVLPDPLPKKYSVKFLTFEENTRKPYNDNLCLFRGLALHLHENEGLEEETFSVFSLFLNKTGGTDPANFRRHCGSGGYCSSRYFFCTIWTL